MPEIRDLGIRDIYSALGYENVSRKLKTLDADAQSFFREYTAQGNVVRTSKVHTEEAQLCARNFLEEDSRGETYWPLNSKDLLAWANVFDREEIIEGLTHIFRLKAFSNYVAQQKEIRDSGAVTVAERPPGDKPKRARKRPRKYRDDNDDGIQSQPLQNEDAFIPPSLEPTTINEWNEPPKEPTSKFCADYIRDLNPQGDLAPIAEFNRKWLSAKSDAKWPIAADSRLLRFMFDNGLFMDYDYANVSAQLRRILRQGTEIEEMRASEENWFLDLVKSRVKELTYQLTHHPCFILAYRRDGVVKMTERFERMWKKKEAYWEEESGSSTVDVPRPAKKRRKSKAVRAKTPIVFPGLCGYDGLNTREQEVTDWQEQGDMRSLMQLASMAETALELSTDQERRPDTSFFADAMNVLSGPECEVSRDVPASPRTTTRSASPNDSTVVGRLPTEHGESPNTIPSLSPSPNNRVLQRQVSRSPTVESIPYQPSLFQKSSSLDRIAPISPGSTLPSQRLRAETEQNSNMATNEEAEAKKIQDAFDKLFTTMRGLSQRALSTSTGQSMNSTASATSLSNGTADSMSNSTLNIQHRRQSTSTGDDDANWLSPKRSPVARVEDPNYSTIPDKSQVPAITSGQEEYHSPYETQGAMNPENRNQGCQAYTSNVPGSSRSSPVEIEDDSDSPASLDAMSPRDILIPADTHSSDASTQICEVDKTVTTGVQLRSDVPPSARVSSNIHSLLSGWSNNGPTAEHHQSTAINSAPAGSIGHKSGRPDETCATMLGGDSTSNAPNPYMSQLTQGATPCAASARSSRPVLTASVTGPPLMSAGELQTSSPSRPQHIHHQHDSLPPRHLVHTANSPRAELPPIRETTGWKSSAPIYEQAQALDSAGLQPACVSPCSSMQSSNEPHQSPGGEGTSKRKASPCPLRPLNEIQRARPPTPPARPETNSNRIPVEELRDTWTQPRLRDIAAPRLTLAISESQGNSLPQPSLPLISNTSVESHGDAGISPLHDSPRVACNPYPANQSISQVGNRSVQYRSADSPLKSPTVCPSEKYVPGQTIKESQSVPQISEPSRSFKIPSNTTSEFSNSLNLAPSPTDLDMLMDEEDFVKDIDEFIMKEGNCDLRKETSLKPTPSPTSPSSSYHHPSQPQSPISQWASNPKASLSNPSGQPHQHSQPQLPISPGTLSQGQASTGKPHQNLPSPATTKPIELSSPSRDVIRTSEKTAVMPTEEPITPPAESSTPQRRNGSYSFVPPPIQFSPYKSNATHPPNSNPAPVLSTDTRLATTSHSSNSSTPTLILLIDSADGNMRLETTHPFDIVKNSSLSEFFQFFASVSGMPLSSLTCLTFLPTFGKSRGIDVRRDGGDKAWRRLKNLMLSLFKDAVKKDRDGEMEWGIWVSGE